MQQLSVGLRLRDNLHALKAEDFVQRLMTLKLRPSLQYYSFVLFFSIVGTMD